MRLSKKVYIFVPAVFSQQRQKVIRKRQAENIVKYYQWFSLYGEIVFSFFFFPISYSLQIYYSKHGLFCR